MIWTNQKLQVCVDDWSFIISLDKISFPAISFPQHTSVLTHNILKCCSVHESFFSPEVMTEKNDIASAFIHIYKPLSLRSIWSLAHGQQLWMWMLTGQSSVSVALHTEYCIRCVTASSVRLVRRWSNRGVSRWHELCRETASPVPGAPMCFEGILRSCYQFCSHWQSTVWRSSTELTREMGGKNWWAQRMPSESVSRHSFAVRLCELREDFPCVPLLAWAVCAVHQTLEEERSSSCFLLCVCVS